MSVKIQRAKKIMSEGKVIRKKILSGLVIYDLKLLREWATEKEIEFEEITEEIREDLAKGKEEKYSPLIARNIYRENNDIFNIKRNIRILDFLISTTETTVSTDD